MNPHHLPAPRRILIVEPNAASRIALELTLNEAGYRKVISVSSCEDAIYALHRHRIDATIISADFPDVVVLETSKKIAKRASCAILLIASSLSANQVRQAAQVGITSFLIRPLNVAQIRPTLEIAFSNWQTTLDAETQLVRLKQQYETRDLVDSAKRAIMANRGISETEAYRLIRSASMNTRRPIWEVAQRIVSRLGESPASADRVVSAI